MTDACIIQSTERYREDVVREGQSWFYRVQRQEWGSCRRRRSTDGTTIPTSEATGKKLMK